jgi:glutamine amidotransferase-like uncharacterized protein
MHRLLLSYLIVISLLGFFACKTPGDKTSRSVLLFNGTGCSINDVAALETILSKNNISYTKVNSNELNKMDQSRLLSYRLLIIPGGNFIEIGKSLNRNTGTNIRNSVHNGLNYLGICGGAFLAGKSGYYNGLDLTSGKRFGFYSAEEHGIHKAVVPIALANADTLNQYWEDGPQLSGWGSVIGKYPDGTPAIVEGTFGKGKVLISGIHAEAPENWYNGMLISTPIEVNNAYAAKLIRAGLNQLTLPHY